MKFIKISNTINEDLSQDIFNNNQINEDFISFIINEIDQALNTLDIFNTKEIYLVNFLSSKNYDNNSSIEVLIYLKDCSSENIEILETLLSKISKNVFYKNRDVVFYVTNNELDFEKYFSIYDIINNKYMKNGEDIGASVDFYFKNLLDNEDKLDDQELYEEVNKYKNEDKVKIKNTFNIFKTKNLFDMLSEPNYNKIDSNKIKKANRISKIKKILFE